MVNANWPLTPKALLEARYQAYVDGNVDFILETIHPDTREQHDRKTVEEWSKNSKWLGLNIEDDHEHGDTAHVTFEVKYEEQGKVVEHREVAEFKKEEGRWYYYDSSFPKAATFKREGEKVGRNDPCPCGSGKKFKKCCAAA